MTQFAAKYTQDLKDAVCARLDSPDQPSVRVVLDALMDGKLEGVDVPADRPSEASVGDWKRQYAATKTDELATDNPSQLVEQMGERGLAVLNKMLEPIEKRAKAGKPRQGDAAAVERIMKAAKQCAKPAKPEPTTPETPTDAEAEHVGESEEEKAERELAALIPE